MSLETVTWTRSTMYDQIDELLGGMADAKLIMCVLCDLCDLYAGPLDVRSVPGRTWSAVVQRAALTAL